MTPARSLAAGAVALGFASTLTAPMPALAAPELCERAENYAAQSGAELLKINQLSVRTVGAAADAAAASGDAAADDGAVADGAVAGGAVAGGAVAGDKAAGDSGMGGGVAASGEPVLTEVGLGEAKAAMVGDARINSAAAVRMLEGQATGKAELTGPVLQLAPPSNPETTKLGTPADRVGPMKIGTGDVAAHARWNTGMACGRTAGEAGRGGASLSRFDLLDGLVRIPEEISGTSTTAMEGTGDDARAVASATIAAGRIELVGGRVKIRVLRPPILVTGMSKVSGGEVRYRPAMIEVSGKGITTKRLATVGDHVEVLLGTKTATGQAAGRSTGQGSTHGTPPGTKQATGYATESALAAPGSLTGAVPPLPIPAIPGLPSMGDSETESAPATGPGSTLRISLGDARQVSKGRAIAARATAIEVAISQGNPTPGPHNPRTGPGYGEQPATVALTMGFGVLETAAMSPDLTEAPATDTSGAGGAAGVGLPVTGAQAGLIALAGLGLVLTGVAAVFLSRRRRRAHY
ncbi:LPXTG cell wall anchor domain-containing protein [Micromonosporaceae bacterium Da 78-11]